MSTRGRTLRALVVDADDAARHLTQGVLMRLGLEVVVAGSSDDAVTLARTERPDFILASIDDQHHEGFAAVDRVRALYPREHLPVLFITAGRADSELLDCHAHGGDVIRRPLSEALLRARLGAALRMRELHDTIAFQRDQLLRYQSNMQHDMDVAKLILGNFATEEALAAPNVSYLLRPMETLNGDFIMAARRPSGAQCFILGDFTGHGLPAAIGVLVVHGVFCSMVAKGFEIDVVAGEINRKMYELLPIDRFLSAVLIDLDPATGVLTIWNGGLPTVLVRAADGTVRERVPSGYVPLGILSQDQFSAQPTRINLAAGERVLAYSDGVIETLDPSGELFGQERLEACLERAPDNAVAAVAAALDGFRHGEAQRDDVSLLEIAQVPIEARADAVATLAGAPRHLARSWRLELVIDEAIIKSQDPITSLVGLADTLQGFGAHAADLYLVISALYIDAIDNGLLGLGDFDREAVGAANYFAERQARLDRLGAACIRIDLDHAPAASGGKLHVTVAHDGSARTVHTEDVTMFVHRRFRRGGSAAEAVARTLRRSDDGRSVSVTYAWQTPQAAHAD
ncbi:MAG: SpoIIE family protein phosphatase [Gammaproteobacteria bacterium]|nr:SpoIIE family protein phosphatase [Gammaproteobacteria bacterium]MCP5199192.1 SpoIIE family protein phosphatase [Gammaproteobacteria bacterium]